MVALASIGRHPCTATHSIYCRWVTEWGCGPVQTQLKQTML